MASSEGKQISRALGQARRLWPYVLIAWERWQSLPQEEKERYKHQARDYVARARKLLDAQRQSPR